MTVLPVAAAPGSGFNPERPHPLTGKIRPHTGQDFPCPVGTPVIAVLPGKVEKTGFDPKRADGGTGAGQFLRLDHGVIDGHRITSRAYHLSGVLAARRFDAGDTVALSGNTGDSTGPHLHFEIRVDGVPVDPMAWLAAHDQSEEDEMGLSPEQENKVDHIIAMLGEIPERVWLRPITGLDGVGVQAWAWLRDTRIIAGHIAATGAVVDAQALAAALAPLLPEAVAGLSDDGLDTLVQRLPETVAERLRARL